ncbi:LamG-like jellyroll fold domain-containing protein [Lysinibacillus parviboronicapiens]|uniref:LamG-like jellyroll fold domain-containing protein n=1 Tax=Lysinibacillus parviboronicapiens TaxID=436516 RepID=UPI000D3D8716|nr:LamG-like jellyroll fold domain-containing protein [Lysinibacillus parviboronicapiens]
MKKFLVAVLSFIILFSLSVNVSSADSGTSLISEYNFESDIESTIVDSTGAHNGTANGTTLVTGWDGIGTARSFNGTSDYIVLKNPVIPSGKFSIKVKIKTTDSNSRIIGTTPGGSNGIVLGVSGEKIGVHIQNDMGAKSYHSTKKINDNEWHDILITWDGTTNENGLKMYIDDMSAVESEHTVIYALSSHKYNASIGTDAGTNSQLFYKGYLDNLEIYNDVINPVPIDPVPIEPEKINSKLFISMDSFFKLTHEGEVYSWGENNYGQLGLGDTIKRKINEKEKIQLPEKIIDIVVGKNFVIALGTSGKVYGWGDNASGVLAETMGPITSPIEIDSNIDSIIDAD